MHIEFELQALDDIRPWGDAQNPSLHWFGFTDGLYCIGVGSDYLLSYSEAVRAPFAKEYPEAYSGPCVDYQVVRLWEDLIEMLPYVLEPVPKKIVHYLEQDYAATEAYSDRVHEWWDAQDAADAPKGLTSEIADTATLWQDHRFLDNGYLSPSARIWMWSEDDVVRIAWDNRDIVIDGQPVWSAQRGAYSLSREAFLDAVRAFDRALIGQMADRVDQVCRHWNRPEIHVDFDGLRRDHDDRATWLQNRLDYRDRFATDWEAVAAAMKTIDSA